MCYVIFLIVTLYFEDQNKFILTNNLLCMFHWYDFMNIERIESYFVKFGDFLNLFKICS